jgi:ribonuclease HI
VARAVWFRRNAVVHGRHIGLPNIVVNQALSNLEAFQLANSKQHTMGVANPSADQRWKAPPVDFVKINWDAAVDSVNRRMGIGVIVRDHTREVIATISAPKNYITALDIAEAVAALKAVTFCRERGLSKVVLEGANKLKHQMSLTNYISIVETPNTISSYKTKTASKTSLAQSHVQPKYNKKTQHN